MSEENYAERIEKIKYYGSELSEGYELFKSICSLAYQMNGIGDPEKVPILVKWAEDYAEESLKYVEEYEPDNLDEFIMGEWDY